MLEASMRRRPHPDRSTVFALPRDRWEAFLAALEGPPPPQAAEGLTPRMPGAAARPERPERPTLRDVARDAGTALRVEPLHPDHDLSRFSCGDPELDRWLVSYALANHVAGFTRTFVVHRGSVVVGFYALSMAAVQRRSAPRKVGRGGPPVVPVALLARLGVDTSEQGRGLGAALLKDAVQRAARAASDVGARALVVHAKHPRARAFDQLSGPVRSPTDHLHLLIRFEDLATG